MEVTKLCSFILTQLSMLLIFLLSITMAVSVCTINVNGIHESAKRDKIFKSIREQNCDITFVQEAHISNPAEMQSWETQWGGKAFWSPGSTHARGVGILFKPNFAFDFLGLRHDTQA